MTAEDALEFLKVRDPAALRLAEVASLAVEIEPALLRRLRRNLVPEASPLAEAVLWSSPLTSSRTPSSLLIRDDVLPLLRERLREDQDRLDAARALVEATHRGIPEILRCEEELIYLGLVSVEQKPRPGLDQVKIEEQVRERLEQVLRSIAEDASRRESLLAWSSRALSTLPERVQTNDAYTVLATITSTGLSGAGKALSALFPPGEQDMSIGVRWTTTELVFSAHENAALVLRLPPIKPPIVEVETATGDGWTPLGRIVVPPQDSVTVNLGANVTRLRLRSLRGDGWILHRQLDESSRAGLPEFSNVWVQVAGTAQYELNPLEAQAAEQLGVALAENGCGVITGAFAGVDHIVSRAFLDRLASTSGTKGKRTGHDRLMRVVQRERSPDFPQGVLHRVDSLLDEYWRPVEQAAAVVIIGHAPGTREVALTAERAGRPVFAYPGTGAETIPNVVSIPENPKEEPVESAPVAARIVRRILMHAASPSEISRWAGEKVKALAISYLRPQPLSESDTIANRLREAIRQRAHDSGVGPPESALLSHNPPERVIQYLAAQLSPRAKLLGPLGQAITRELPFAERFSETRPMWQGLVALERVLALPEIQSDPSWSKIAGQLQGILSALEHRSHLDEGGECKVLLRRMISAVGRKAEGTLRGLNPMRPRVQDETVTQALQSVDVRSKVDVAIITIREDEFEAVLAHFPAVGHVFGRRQYNLRQVHLSGGGSYLVAVVRCIEQGNGEAQSVVQDLLEELKPRCLLVVGIAGSVPSNELGLGDVIVATRVYDFGVETGVQAGEPGYASREVPVYESAAALVANVPLGGWNTSELLAVSRPAVPSGGTLVHGDKKWRQRVQESLSQLQRRTHPIVTLGAIASSDRLIKSGDILSTWMKMTRQVRAIEMESAGVYRAAYEQEVPTISIRGISDIIGLKRDPAWTEYACHTAASFALALLQARPFESRNQTSSVQAMRPVPDYQDEQSRRLSELIEVARDRRMKLKAAGGSTTAIDQEILGLRRQLREGGQLREGDSVGDGRYLLLRRIGRGGFATVWEAYDEGHAQRVAIKVLHAEMASNVTMLESFFRGARIMSEFAHEAIVRILAPFGEDGGFYYFVMEFIAGADFRSAVLSGRVAPDAVITIILRVGSALARVHARNVVHRDIKPSNILIDETGAPRLTDFDLVGGVDTTGGTRTGALGTFVYAAPELMHRPQDADARTDVYGLGMTLLFGLHGRELTLDTIQDTEKRKLIQKLPCNEAIKKVIRRAVNRDPKARFENATEFCHALEGAMGGRKDRKGSKPQDIDIKEIAREQFAALKVADDQAHMRALIIEELEFFQNTATGHLGVLVRDRTDNDFGYAIWAKTEGDYQAVKFKTSIASRDEARKELLAALK